jgi:hypothetical protein
MKTLGDNPNNGRISLGGLRATGMATRGGSARKGIVLYARPIAFSIVNGAADDRAQRDEAKYGGSGGGGTTSGIVRTQQR